MEKQRLTWGNTIALFLASLSLFGSSLAFSHQIERYTKPVVIIEQYSYNPISEFVTETRSNALPVFMTARSETVESAPDDKDGDALNEMKLSRYEIELIATVTMAEAEGESELGQRLVIDTILNRVDHDRFPSTVHAVVHQKNQFSVIGSDRIKRCYPKAEIIALVEEELVSRTNSEVVFFRGGHYGRYGTPLFQVGGHYFSKYV